MCRNVIILEQVTINSCTITYTAAPVQVRLVEILVEFSSNHSSQAEATLVDVTYSKECSEQMVTVCQPGYGRYGGKWPDWSMVHLHVEIKSQELKPAAKLSYAIKNQLWHQKPPKWGALERGTGILCLSLVLYGIRELAHFENISTQ